MTKDFFSIQKDRTVGEAIEEFRKTTCPLESVAYLYVTDKENRLVGVSTLRHLITCDKDIPLKKLMNTHIIKVHPLDSIEEVAELFKKYKFLSLPVADENDVLTGIITLKDIMGA
jgi:magnesium transporter